MIRILAAVHWADSYHTEKRNGYLKMVYTKTSRGRYLISKYMVTFLSGAAAVALPLLLSLYFSLLYLPAQPLDAFYRYIPYFFLNADVGAPMTSGFLMAMGSVILIISLTEFLYLGKKDEIF